MERRCKKPRPAASEVQKCVLDDVPDDLLRLILLRLDSPLWLVRAVCACKRWLRIVDGGDGGRAFLRLASSLHPPVVIGHYDGYHYGGYSSLGTDGDGFVPSSQTLIRPSLVFFPLGISHPHPFNHRWHVADCHGGLVLLRSAGCMFIDSNLVVCDPLSRRYRNIHHPANQTSYNFLTDLQRSPNLAIHPRVFLLDGGDDDGSISLSNFRVLYCCSYLDVNDQYGRRVSKVHAFSTADGGGGWRLVRQAFDHGRLYDRYWGYVIGRIDRSLYLASHVPGRHAVVRVLDNANANARLELSEVDLPSRARRIGLDYQAFAVVHGASPATAYIVHVIGEDLEVFGRITSSGEWVLQHSIPRLSEATHGLQGHPEPSRWMGVKQVIAGGTGLAVLKVTLTCDDGNWLFSLDVNTMRLQVVPSDMDSYPINPIIYTLPWPQFLKGALPS